MKKIYGMATIVFLAGLCYAAEPVVQTPFSANPAYWSWAKTPPMGWNSWDCFGTTLTEEQAKAQADAMEKHLKPYGWTWFTVDIQWYEPDSQGHGYRRGARLEMDEYSRLIPALKKFPSSSDGRGFRPLAGLCPRQGSEIRHPYHARYSQTGGA
jgi:hypothetical protein